MVLIFYMKLYAFNIGPVLTTRWTGPDCDHIWILPNRLYNRILYKFQINCTVGSLAVTLGKPGVPKL